MESFFRLHFDVPWRMVLATESTGRRDTISGLAGGQDTRRRCGSLRPIPSPGRSMCGQRKHGSLEPRHNFEPPTVMVDDILYRKTVSLHSLYKHQPAPWTSTPPHPLERTLQIKHKAPRTTTKKQPASRMNYVRERLLSDESTISSHGKQKRQRAVAESSDDKERGVVLQADKN